MAHAHETSVHASRLGPVRLPIHFFAVATEIDRGANDDSFPVKPHRLVADIRRAMGRSDIVLVDTGALKMWMARLDPTYVANTCLISNGLSAMGFALPGAIAAKLAHPGRKVLAVTGDGGFLMNSQELETAVREKIPFVVLVWEDGAYGLIKWKMDLELGRDSNCDFTNPDFVAYAESLGMKGFHVSAAAKLLASTISVSGWPRTRPMTFWHRFGTRRRSQPDPI